MYTIQPYTKQQAKKIGVMVRPSTDPKKKVDVFKDDQKVASIGAVGFSDYPHYLQDKGKAVADERRRLYHIRHKKDSSKKGSPGYYASRLLW
jgi:hypothetical protein